MFGMYQQISGGMYYVYHVDIYSRLMKHNHFFFLYKDS